MQFNMKMSKFMARENLVRTEILNRNHEGRRTPLRPPETYVYNICIVEINRFFISIFAIV
jgi:hypothetical protein